MIRRHRFAPDGLHIREHRQSGRNRLFIVEGLDGRLWIAKQNLTFPGAERWFYARVAPLFDAAPACLIADARADVVVLEHLTEATTLYDMVWNDAPAAFALCSNLASDLAQLHAMGASLPDAPMARIPFPSLDPIDIHVWLGSSPAVRAFVTHLQERTQLSTLFQQSLNGAGPHGLVHADLKLDNILKTPERLFIVDWELCGRGPLGWDLGAILGSMMVYWADLWMVAVQSPSAAERDRHSISFEDVSQAARAFMKAYLNHADVLGLVVPDRPSVVAHTAAWIIGRSWSEAALAFRLTPHLPMRLAVAEELVRHPAQLFGDMLW